MRTLGSTKRDPKERFRRYRFWRLLWAVKATRKLDQRDEQLTCRK